MSTTQPTPPGPVGPPIFEVRDHGGGHALPVGDVTQTGEQPLFDQDPSEVLNVVVNVSYARQEGGTRAVRVLDRSGRVLLHLSAAQAHQLAVDLTQSADVVGGIRQAAGFET